MSKEVTPQGNPADRVIVFQEIAIRRTWYKEKWWFSVVDVCGVLTASADAGAYWRKLKQRLGAEGSEYAILTAEIARATFGVTPGAHRRLKGLDKVKTGNQLRDHMTDPELIFTMLGEASTTEIARRKDAQGLDDNRHAANRW